MAEVRGLGVCLINTAGGTPCGKQIQDGEAIGTIINEQRQPVVGHKKCADAYGMRQAGRTPVKQAKQDPSGAVGEFTEALAQGSVPLEKPVQSLAEVPMPPGVKSLADLPFEEVPTPVETLPPRGAQTKAQVKPTSVRLGGSREERLQQLREALAAAEQENDEPVVYDIHLDMAEVPRETEVIRIHLDLRNITD